MNKYLFSLVCAAALLTELNAEILDGNGGLEFQRKSYKEITSDITYENISVGDWSSKLDDKNSKEEP